MIWVRANVVLAAAILLIAPTALPQRQPEKPKLHSDFNFGTYPPLRDAPPLFSQTNVKLLLVGFHQNWDIEKIAKESKVAEVEFDRLFADLEDANLARQIDQYERRPMLPVIRDKDIERIQRSLQIHTMELTNLLRSNWPEIETAIGPLAGTKEIPRAQLMYQVVAGAILFGGMHDTFFDDQTIMIPPTRRAGSQRYHAWLVEGDPALAGLVKREQWESDGYTMVSIGKGLSQNRPNLERVRSEKGMVLDEADARRFRSFVGIFARERVLPYFKRNRSGILDVARQFDAGKYNISVSSVFAWYYDQLANRVVENLVSAKMIQPPVAQYTFALKVPGPR